MKRYIYLFLATLITLAVIIMSGYMIKNNTVEAEVFILSPEDVNNTVTSSGKLQYKSEKSVKSEDMGIIKTINVKNGDSIKKGDLLFSYYQVNDAYRNFISQYTDFQGLENIAENFTDLNVKQKVIDEAKKYCTVKNVYAQNDGKVVGIEYRVDDLINKNADIIKLSDTSLLEIPVNINETYIDKIKLEQDAEITFNAVPDKIYRGKVTKISDEAVQTTGLSGKETTVGVTVTLNDKKDENLRIGYSADCSIITSVDKNVLVLPYEYIHSDDVGDYVFKAVKNKSQKVYIKTGKEYKNGAEVVSALNENDLIITNAENLYDGKTITVKKQMESING